MCGILGIFFRYGAGGLEKGVLRGMRDTIVHRGPDACGLFADNSVGLAHRRLRIIDLQGSHQPMSNEDGSIWVIFNGEIYNYQYLRSFLSQRGHTLKTKGDTEVIVHLYEEYGAAFVEHLNGIFSIAIWDSKEQTLLLIRDRLGVKPLYYYPQPDHIVFASEIKAILVSPSYRPAINHSVLYSFFNFSDVYGEQTLFEGIYELKPGHILKADHKGVLSYKYWDISVDPNGHRQSDACLLEQLEEHMRRVVRLQMVSDVPVGAFLSGGVDSSLLVAYMSEIRGTPVKTFSIGFREDEGNEFEYSRFVARQFHTEHYEYLLSEKEFIEALPRAIWHQDEPLRHHASVPLLILSRHSKEQVTVLLSGEGADELFLGYRYYRLAHIQNYLNKMYQTVIPTPLWHKLAAIGPKITKRKLGSKVINRLSLLPASVALAYSSSIPGVTISSALQGQWFDQANKDYFEGLFENAPARGFYNQFAYADIKTHLVSLLMKQDKMSMGASIETRVPFLDHELVEFAFALPRSLKVRAQTGKYLLKKLAERKLPRELIYRRKMGFPVPLTHWLQTGAFKDYVLEVLLDPGTIRRGFFKPSFVERHLSDVESGILGRGSDACGLLWTMLNFELWCRCFIDYDAQRGSVVQSPQSDRIAV